MVTRVINCKVPEIRVALGMGNTLILFEGDNIIISEKDNFKGRYKVIDAHGKVVGTIRRKDVERITQERLPAEVAS